MTSRSLRLVAHSLPVSELDDATVSAMWKLFRRYYERVEQRAFLRDLHAKTHVIVLRDSGDGSVQGFSTLMRFEETVSGRRVAAVFSGDTIVDSAYWGQSALQRCFLRYIVATKLRYPFTPVYWFLISKGYKTYLLLSRNFGEYWPRYDRETPAWQSRVLDRFASRLFPNAWRPWLGLLQFSECPGRLRDGIAHIESHMLAQPDIRFFAQKNPAHARGDELCCLGLIDFKLALSYPMKLLRKLLGIRRRPMSGSGNVSVTPAAIPATASSSSLRRL